VRLQGTAQAPIALVGDGEVVIDAAGKAAGLHLADPRYVVVEGLTVRNAVPHGINIDDGGSYDSPASHIERHRYGQPPNRGAFAGR